MKVAAVRDEEIGVARLERRAARLEHVARHLAQVEHRREEVVAIVVAEHARRVPREAGRHGRPELRHHRHQIAGPLVAVDHPVRLAVHAAVNRVHQPVAPARLRMLEEGRA